ncbi:uncharacterized protein A4U43_C07F9950 [Asparagus officinalis]|uniref:AIG1-type G domain-containing protein n=1 Tax=Asparagus officinalis TaxID=4686 RepID=A0A5P1EAW6_ASPOF|nr:uncharacterized protein A4U43_C07F9950 [Asparagus officinalis]
MQMDSEAKVTANSVSISQSKENGGGDLSSHLETPVVVEDDYETASESEDLNGKNPLPAVERGGSPNLDEAKKSSPAVEDGVSEVVEDKVEGELNQEVRNSDGGGEKGEVFSGGSNAEEVNSAVQEEEEVKGESFVAGAEGNDLGAAEDEKNYGNLVENTKLKSVEDENEAGMGNNSVESTNLKPVEVEAEAGSEKNGEPAAAQHEKKDEGLDGNREFEAVTATSRVGSIQEPEEETDSKPSVETERDVDVDLVGSDQNLEEAAEALKPVEVEINAADTDMVESNAAEKEEMNAAVPEKDTEVINKEEVNSALAQNETEIVDGSVESKVAEAVVAENLEDTDSLAMSQEVHAATESKDVQKETVHTEADKNEADDATGSQGSIDLKTEEEKGVSTSDQVSTDLEAKPSDGGRDLDLHKDVEPSPAPVEDSKSKETEIQPLENSDDDDENPIQNEAEEEEEDGDVTDQQPRVAILDSSETAKQIIKEMEGGSSATSFESSNSYRHEMEGQIVSDSDEEVDTDEEGGEKELFDSAALAALLKAATGGSSEGNFTISSQDGTQVFSMDRPAGLGSSAAALRPAPGRSARPTLFSPSELAVTAEPENEMTEEEKKLHEKVEDIRVKFLRLIMRLGHTSEDTVAAQVLYRLNLAEGIRRGRQMGRSFSIEAAKRKAVQLEEEGEEDLKFSCNILILGKTGVGKSATINSIFGEEKSHTNAFQAATTSVREISGVVDGVKVRVIDTPGLRSSAMEQATNRRILSSIKKYTKKCPPDIVLYVDRLDTQTRDFNDLPLLRSITGALGSSIWFNAIVALTHAASAPPEGPNGSPLSYEVFIAQRSHVVQHSIRQAAGDMRLMNPVALAENHPSCRRNREGQRVLPNGQSWRPQLLLLCYSSKILAEANSLLKLQDPSPGKLFGFRLRSPPLPYLLSTLLQSRTHPKLPSDQGGDDGDSDIDLDDFSDAEDGEEDEYDQLPPFKPLKKSQLAKLTKEQKRAYFDEYDYRVKLLQKKQFKEEIRRLKEMKKRGKSGREESPYGDMGEDFDQDGAPAAVPVPLPDMVLPPSFDCDLPSYRYRFLEPTSQLLTRPVLDSHGWDHDCGYDGVSLEESLAVANRFPAAVAVQITKDKKDFNIHLDSSISAKHGENGSSLAGFDIQSIGKQLAYILRGETKFRNLKKNKTAAGISVTFLGDTVATGLKVEDQLMIGKRVALVASTGTIRAQGDVAYGANLEARLREKDYPIGQSLSTLGLSLMKWRGDLALGANLQSQVNIGRNSKVAVRVGLNNKRSGQITIRTSSSDHLQLALVGIIPVALSVFRNIWPGESEFAH